MPCKHLFIDICHLARQLLQQYDIDAAPRPHASACEFCTNQAKPPQALNEVIVSLALATVRDNPEVITRIRRDHGHLIRQTAREDGGQLADIEQGTGPGSELWHLLSELGVKHKATCSCLSLAAKMNAWGPAGCRLAQAEIVAQMRTNAKEYGWLDVARAAAKAVSTGIGWRLDLTDVYGSLIDEAIRRADDV